MESLIGIISLIIIIAICAIIGSYNKKAKKVKKIKQDKNASLFITLLHYSGLPVAQNIYTKILTVWARGNQDTRFHYYARLNDKY